MSELIESAEGVSPATAQQLQIIAGSMGAVLTVMAGLIAWTSISGAGKIPTPENVRIINLLTTVAMLVAVSCIVASEIAWRSLLKKSAGPLGGRVQIAFIIRLALREGAGLLGMVVAYLAALNGVLRVYPAYWVNGAPFALFLGFLAAHWPSAETLAVEAREILGS